ncbi:glycerate kinase [Lactobacillus johnsonii]|jgi:glycerate kinase|uniref:Glycerate kinase n=1 Tax=Lactobacillus johnsonii TaxID=33959 RepID=A0A9X7XU38_LACJH|nr:glycerate kinase [Lactobacillus johnsonii]MBU5318138.1 glycerate kinase [Lactobacillus johnsonii]MCT3382395.1 glycerate kinase [Lactobacillus johnsonii]MCT3388307.1 glycerate kinase [Lactobacillus johnsonii]MDO5008697.1 glycerate kinase [Lactobacillus johnsonii]MDY6043837.1 glycerate kinase [Lactobacillus johnsonii]
MTKYVVAPDSFKESMTAKEVCDAMEKGIKEADSAAEVIKVPMADGGEGTVDSLVDATQGQRVIVEVTGPLGNKISAYYGILGNGTTAVIEMAKASGLEIVEKKKRNPMITTTFGTGELIRDALDHNVKEIIIGLGGSSTNDGGSGMAQALGAKLLDQNNHQIPFGGGNLDKLDKIDISNLDSRLQDVKIILASDVTNPLIGKDGASRVFGPQKGATPEMVEKLENNLQHYAKIVKRDLNKEVALVSGAGAAGGLGAGLMAFTTCEMRRGVDLAIEVTKLEEKIRDADYVFTGEGGTDFQTKFGKTPYGVAKLGKKYHKPVISLAGYLGEGIDSLYSEGFTAIFGIIPGACDLSTALKNGPSNVARTTENIVRLLNF